MNYRHIYHAGNFADIVKHILLTLIIEKVKEKPNAFAVLDSFAGTGLYNLTSDRANKTKEFNLGIGLLAKHWNLMPKSVRQYLSLVQSFNHSDQIIYYPGSPLIIASLLRDTDRLIATELHKEDAKTLKMNLKPFSRAITLDCDAYQGLKALLPFKEKRGLIFLDPPFEVTNEFDKLINGMSLIYKRFSQAITLVWYPIKDIPGVKNFYNTLRQIYPREILVTEFQIMNPSTSLNSIGLIIVNPPNIVVEFRAILLWLKEEVYSNQADFVIKYLAS